VERDIQRGILLANHGGYEVSYLRQSISIDSPILQGPGDRQVEDTLRGVTYRGC
jgi:hypothetical protein